jgi:hypothetical protein
VVGGAQGGSGQYVYGLGRRGFYVFYEGRYNPARVVNFHALAVANAYLSIRRAERAGAFDVVAYGTEPDCWHEVGGVLLKPDLFVELAKESGEHLQLWCEVDMGTEAQRQLRGKLEAYWRAYQGADVERMPVFPKVIWVAVDDERAKELSRLVGQGSECRLRWPWSLTR